jgi:DNA-binding MarR family transcriptional regulator
MDVTKEEFFGLINEIKGLRKEVSFLKENLNNQTNNPKNKTFQGDFSTNNLGFEALKHQNLEVSTGNQGASTDRQTNRHLDRQTNNSFEFDKNSLNDAFEILDSLDKVKKSIRIKFKQLTRQEILVFATIYQLDEEIGYSDYKIISEKLSLTQSSIRDYVGRLIKKGIPIEKTRVNNKNIKLSVSSNLKKIASLNTILQLRDI